MFIVAVVTVAPYVFAIVLFVVEPSPEIVKAWPATIPVTVIAPVERSELISVAPLKLFRAIVCAWPETLRTLMISMPVPDALGTELAASVSMVRLKVSAVPAPPVRTSDAWSVPPVVAATPTNVSLPEVPGNVSVPVVSVR